VRRWVKLLITIAVFFVALVLSADVGIAFLCGLLAASVCGALDSRWSVAAGLVFLALCPIIVLFDKTTWLQQSPLVAYYLVRALGSGSDPNEAVRNVATWAYYLLGIGVLTHIVRSFGPDSRRKRLDDAR